MKKLIVLSSLQVLITATMLSQSCFTPSWEGNGFDHMNIYVTSAQAYGADLQPGDIIGVFDGITCVGMSTVTETLTGSNYLAIVASKDDPDTPEKDGYTENNPISFRYCLNGNSQAITDVVAFYTAGTGSFSVSGTAQVQLSLPLTVPIVVTSRINTVTSTDAVTGGQVLSEGGSPILIRGVCWSTSPGPTADLITRTEDGSGPLEYISTPSGLSPATTYYLRAYAINSEGIGYGREIIFKTYNSFTARDIDGNYYNTITIGTQTWLVENLLTTRYNNGDLIGTTDPPTLDISSEQEPKYQWPYNGNEGNAIPYGRLYTWYVVADSREVCPDGYHVAGDGDWTALRDYLVSIGYGIESTGNGVGPSMASPGGWVVSGLEGAVGYYQTGNNSSGFTGIACGNRGANGIFGGLGIHSTWWSSNESTSSEAPYYALHYNTQNLTTGIASKKSGMPVRCIKDSDNPNIALNKPASAQTVKYPAAMANDADKLTYWAGSPYPQWWKVDLESVYDITGINLLNYADGKRYYQYRIEASIDDITYTEVVSKATTDLATDAGDSYSVNVTARYLRVTTTYNSANTGVHICDFRVYGTKNESNFIIAGSAGAGGSIDPPGEVAIIPGGSQRYTITPDAGYQIEDVFVDGSSVGAVTEYLFENVTANHTILAIFTAMPSIALNKPVSAQTAKYPAAMANDADKLTYWAGSPYPQWWKVDLESVYDITGINLLNYADGRRYYQYRIEASIDDITYTEVVSKATTDLATDAGDNYSVNVTARYLRVTTTYNSANTGVHICDFRVYGTKNESNFIIAGSAGAGGSIDPPGEVAIIPGGSQRYTIIPDVGYQIEDVFVDGTSIGAIEEYTFENVSAAHTISATFTALTSIALNKPTTSQTSYLPSYNANDADKLTYWDGRPYPQWWKVDLQNIYDIDGIILRNYVDGKRYYHYLIEASLDDITYVPVAEKDNSNLAIDAGDIHIVSITARYLKVTITYNSYNTGAHISDFKVFGSIHNFNITSNCNVGGQISPSEAVSVTSGSDQSFTIIPDFGYQIDDVLVDGTSVGPVSVYTFDNVDTDHTISVTFSERSSIALNKPTTSQTSYLPSTNANDTDKLTYWDGRQYPQWWKVDLQNVYDIDGIVLRNYVDGKRYYKYSIEASLDDITYSPVATKDNTNLATDAGDIYPVSVMARYLKVVITYNSYNTGAHISDFRVYGVLNDGTKGVNVLKSEIKEEDLMQNHNQPEMMLKVYPNPFTDKLTVEINSIDFDLFDLVVFDMAGNIVYLKNDMPTNVSNSINLDITPGIYFLRASIYGEVRYQKIIKQ